MAYGDCCGVCESVQVGVAQFCAASVGHVTGAGVDRRSLIVLVAIFLQTHAEHQTLAWDSAMMVMATIT